MNKQKDIHVYYKQFYILTHLLDNIELFIFIWNQFYGFSLTFNFVDMPCFLPIYIVDH